MTLYELEAAYGQSRNPARNEPYLRSVALLKAELSPSQLWDWEQLGGFGVVGSAGGQYWLTPYLVRNIFDRFTMSKSWCLCPPEPKVLPLGDLLLAQMLIIENNEPWFLEHAAYWD